MIAPTILIGLGGIGSEVVTQVYQKVPEELRGIIPIHIFDTNINDLDFFRKTLGDNRVTQTSRAIRVGQYLQAKDSASPIFQWFPVENKLILRKTLTEGAGQMRVVSRLAYLDAMEHGRMDRLSNQINEMFIHNQEIAAVRVFIVCSLGGGTGAGMFLQTALYLQDILKKHGKDHIIRGAFLLPDAYVKKLSKNQRDDVRANAYACIKELDAITRNVNTQLLGKDGPTINFEYLPDQINENYQDLVITSEHLPYNYCFLFDELNESGKPLPDMDCYKEQMVNTISLQLFSPLSSSQFSVEDNFVRTHIRHGGSNYFCGAGTTRLLYPYKDIVDFLALRQAEEIIDREWYYIDARFNEELRQYRADIASGINRPEPDIGILYPTLINDAGTGTSPHPFFSAIHRSAHIIDEDGRPQAGKAQQFVNAVNQLINDTIKNDSDLRRAAAQCSVERDLIKKKEHAEDEISEMELNLETYERLIEQRIHEHKLLIINRVIGNSCHETQTVGSQDDYQLNTWLLHRPEPLHPVAVRYVLYKVCNLLDEQLKKIEPQNSALSKAIENYEKRYDDPDTEHVEDPNERVAMALEQPFFQSLYKNHFKEFVKDYQEGSTEHLNRLNHYKVERLRELVLSTLYQLVLQLSANWERFFHGLDHVKTSFRNQTNLQKSKHEQDNDSTVRYVLASSLAKEQLWDTIQPQLGSSSNLPSDLRSKIYLDQFSLFCRQAFPNHERMTLGGESTSLDMEKRVDNIFRESLVEHFRQLIGNIAQLDLNIGEALRYEYQLEYRQHHQDFTGYLQAISQHMYMHAEPMINHRPLPDASLQKMIAWGIHEELRQTLQESEFKALLNLNEEPAVTETDFFSRYEAQLLRTTIGLRAEDLATFQPPSEGYQSEEGTYYRAYQKLIHRLKMDAVSEVTPHLDKNWHMPAYLPDLNQNIALMDEVKKRRAFILGLIYRKFAVTKKDQKDIWQRYIPSGGRNHISQSGEYVTGTFLRLYQTLAYNPAIVDDILKAAEEQQEEQQNDTTIDFFSSRFSTGCRELSPGKVMGFSVTSPNIFDAIFQLINDCREDFQEETEKLLRQIIDEIHGFSLAVTGKTRKNTARDNAQQLIEELARDSNILTASKTDQNNAFDGWNSIINDYQPEFQVDKA